MVRTFRYHRTPVFWIVAFALAAMAAYYTEQEITFVPGVPTSGYVQAYLILFALWFVGILAAWFLAQLLLFIVGR